MTTLVIHSPLGFELQQAKLIIFAIIWVVAASECLCKKWTAGAKDQLWKPGDVDLIL